MGSNIDQVSFSPEDHSRFRGKLKQNLEALKKLLKQPGFGGNKASFGAELELYIIDSEGRPKPINQALHSAVNDPLLTLELNRFNLEYNFSPVSASSSPFSEMQNQMTQVLASLSQHAKQFDARILPIGILPTLDIADLGMGAMTDIARYHALADELKKRRGGDFHIQIDGQDSLDFVWGDITLEGANTSFQFHYRVSPDRFAQAYNAAQLITPMALALGANSPIFLGKRLWHETRIALFKQSIDTRLDDPLTRRLPARVSFGNGWLRESAYELFAEGVYLYDCLLPICSDDDPVQQIASGNTPSLKELRLHQGSIWIWNRPIYDPAEDGHLRIELRAMPAGPCAINMMANAALMSGLISGLEDSVADLLPALPFRYAEQNFYRAAKYGLGANLFWPNLNSGRLEEKPVDQIIKDLLPQAEEGLAKLGVSSQETQKQLAVINGSLDAKMNGANWQLAVYERLCAKNTPQEALKQMLELYYQNCKRNLPIHEWETRI